MKTIIKWSIGAGLIFLLIISLIQLGMVVSVNLGPMALLLYIFMIMGAFLGLIAHATNPL